MQRTERQDIYIPITNQIVSHLEQGVRPWVRPVERRTCRGTNHAPTPPQPEALPWINVLSPWASAMAQNFAAPIWMTFRQASELDLRIRKGEKGFACLLCGQHHPKAIATECFTEERVLSLPTATGHKKDQESRSPLPTIFLNNLASSSLSARRQVPAEPTAENCFGETGC